MPIKRQRQIRADLIFLAQIIQELPLPLGRRSIAGEDLVDKSWRQERLAENGRGRAIAQVRLMSDIGVDLWGRSRLGHSVMGRTDRTQYQQTNEGYHPSPEQIGEKLAHCRPPFERTALKPLQRPANTVRGKEARLSFDESATKSVLGSPPTTTSKCPPG